MKGKPDKAGYAALLILIVAPLLWFSLACRLASFTPQEARTGNSFWDRLFGSAAGALSGDMYQMADRYFHKGVGHLEETGFSSWFGRLQEEVSPNQHVHLSDEGDVLEMMPWLRMATRIDPHNIEAYQVAIYWLASEGKIEAAKRVLREAMRKNSFDYRLYTEKGLLYIKNEMPQKAAKALDTALELWPEPLRKSAQEAKLDLAQILSYRAFLYELEGDFQKAIDLYRREYSLFPERKQLLKHISKLQKGTLTREELEERWKEVSESEHIIRKSSHHHNHH